MRQIVISISPAGSVNIDAQGFKGVGCAKATEQLEVVLGGRAAPQSKKKKPEFFASPATKAGQKLTFWGGSMEYVINIAPSGRVTAMHSDKFSLEFLGPQKIERASDIRWNVYPQSWGIWFQVNGIFLPPGSAYSGFPTYEAARLFEVAAMNEGMKQGVTPLHLSIKDWAEEVRLVDR
jgi:Protein of unknown function (DUF2997)